MSSPLEDGAARQSVKVTERPSGLDEPLVQVPSGTGFGRNAEPGAFRLPGSLAPGVDTFCPLKCGHLHWGQRSHALLRIFGSALVGGLAAAVVLSPRDFAIRGEIGTCGRTAAASIFP